MKRIAPRLFAAALIVGVACADTNDPAQATKESPYVNSLGMKFVPVPIYNRSKVVRERLFCTTELTVDQYKAQGKGYQSPTFPQEGNHPAVNVSWNDAQSFCKWLSEREGNKYRLPSDHEWSCAIGIGQMEDPTVTPLKKAYKIADVYPWGHGYPPPTGVGNYRGRECRTNVLEPDSMFVFNYYDGFVYTSPVGFFTPNSLGIHDLGGNVSEWCEDKPDTDSRENRRVVRGGCFSSVVPSALLSSLRYYFDSGDRRKNIGVRVVLDK